MSKQDSLKTQNCILKVHIDCNGCAQKVKKRLKKIDGVYSVNIDVEQGKVVVVGNVDPAKLIKKLESSGTHAELWGGVQTNKTSSSINNQFQNFQIDNFSKGGKDNKSKKGDGGGQVPANIKEVHVLKVPNKEHKSVKFHLPEDTNDHGHDDLEDYSDDEEEGYGHGHAKPMIRNGAGLRGPVGMMNGLNHKGNNGNGKEGNIIDPTMLIKGKSGNRNHNDAKKGNKVEKQNSGDQKDNENKKNEKYMVGGEGDGIKKKSGGGGLVGRFLRFGKKSKKGGVVSADDTHKNNYNEIKEEKEGDGKLEGGGKSKNGKGNNGNGNMGQMGPIDIRAVQRHPAMNGGGGYHQGVQMQMQPPPYNQNQQQQQYMAMMMNQQQQHQQQQQQQGYMNNMYPQAMMYGGQHPSMNYMPPPPPIPVHPMNDPMTHTFSDENVDGCTIM